MEENGGKVRLFHKAFFYDKLAAAEILQDHQYLLPAFQWTPITNAEIYAVAAKLSPHKAPGLSGIPNDIIMKT